MALIELFGLLKHFREKRLRENLDQRELLRRELIQIAFAVVTIIVIMASLFVLAYWILK